MGITPAEYKAWIDRMYAASPPLRAFRNIHLDYADRVGGVAKWYLQITRPWLWSKPGHRVSKIECARLLGITEVEMDRVRVAILADVLPKWHAHPDFTPNLQLPA